MAEIDEEAVPPDKGDGTAGIGGEKEGALLRVKMLAGENADEDLTAAVKQGEGVPAAVAEPGRLEESGTKEPGLPDGEVGAVPFQDEPCRKAEDARYEVEPLAGRELFEKRDQDQREGDAVQDAEDDGDLRIPREAPGEPGGGGEPEGDGEEPRAPPEIACRKGAADPRQREKNKDDGVTDGKADVPPPVEEGGAAERRGKAGARIIRKEDGEKPAEVVHKMVKDHQKNGDPAEKIQLVDPRPLLLSRLHRSSLPFRFLQFSTPAPVRQASADGTDKNIKYVCAKMM